jgi:hypothetical protein
LPQPDDLQFETAEPATRPTTPGGAGTDALGPLEVTCAACERPIERLYFAAGDKVVCPECRERYVAAMGSGSPAIRTLKAALFGVAAGVASVLLWTVIRQITGGKLIGIYALFVGLAVGGAVFLGSGKRGGRAYQVLALILTYCAVCGTFVPEIIAHARESGFSDATSQPTTEPTEPFWDEPTTAETLVLYATLFVVALAAPFTGGVVIIWFMVGIALLEAWRLNTRRAVDLAGPYALTPNPPPAQGWA